MRWRSGSAMTKSRMAAMRSSRSNVDSTPGVLSGTSGVVPVSASGFVKVDGGGGTLVAGVARVVDAKVGGNAVEPGAEAGLRAVGFARAVDAQENLLGELFGDGLVARHAVHEVDDGLAIFVEQEVEAGHVSGFELEHDGGVVHVAEIATNMKARVGIFRVRKPVQMGRGKMCRVERQGCHIFCNPNVRIWLRRVRNFCRISVVRLALEVGEAIGGAPVDGPAECVGARNRRLPAPGRRGRDHGRGRRERDIHALHYCTCCTCSVSAAGPAAMHEGAENGMLELTRRARPGHGRQPGTRAGS